MFLTILYEIILEIFNDFPPLIIQMENILFWGFLVVKVTPTVMNTTGDSCLMLQDYNKYKHLDSVCWRRGE